MGTKESKEVIDYYSQLVAKFGATPKGVDWNGKESQEIRFSQLLKLLEKDQKASVLDYGCGYGAFYSYVKNLGLRIDYYGYDLSHEMISEAKKLFPGIQAHCELPNSRSDYIIASGLFNVKLACTNKDWEDYVFSTIENMWSICNKGIAFNILTSYSDEDRMKDYLFYAKPELFFSKAKELSRNVALDHDYDLYEFTIRIKK